MKTSGSELFEINISNKLTFFGFIDEQGHSWILFKTFFNTLRQGFEERYEYYTHMETVYNTHIRIIKSINSDLLHTAVLRKIHLQKNNISQNFRLGSYVLIDKEFFINQYLEKGFDNFFWEHFKEHYNKNKLYHAVANRLAITNLAKDKINDLFVKKLVSDKNSNINNNSNTDNNADVKSFNSNQLSDIDDNFLSQQMQKAAQKQQNIDTNLYLQKISQQAASKSIESINLDELNNLIATAIEKSIPKIVDSITDILLITAPGSGTKSYHADKITTIQPNTEKYFCIRDFLIEKNVSLIFLKFFGGIVASHYGSVAIKYFPPNSNSNEAGYNYYPIKYKPLIEKLFSKFLKNIIPNNQVKEAL